MSCRSVLALTVRALPVLTLVTTIAAVPTRADVRDLRPGQWSAGAGVGFLANSPDGPEFGLTGHGDYLLAERLSVGLLGQYAGAGNDILFLVSAQAKYWWSILASGNAKLVVQGGIGFVWADIRDSDSGLGDTYTSFVIPLGVGLDYAVTPRVAVTVDVILNLTSLGEHVSRGGREVDLHTNIMPGLFLGVRF